MISGAVTGTKLVVNDVKANELFYVALGLKVANRNVGGEAEVRQEQCWLSSTGQMDGHILILSRFLELGPMPDPTYPGEAWLGFRVSDVEAAVEAAQAAGGRLIRPGQDRPEHKVRAALVSDPAGHIVEIVGPLLSG